MTKLRVAFAGMTHLGIVSATAMASKGFETICYDSDAALIDALRDHKSPVAEPGLEDLARANGLRQAFSSDLSSLSACDLVYIAADVPTDNEGVSDLTSIRRLIDKVATVLRPHATLVVLCQVPPGFTRTMKILPHERVFYQVETLVFGRAVERATRPERFIIGCDDPARGLPTPLKQVLGSFGCPILPMRYESAELAKIAINMCLVSSITVANMMAELCEEIGADWSEIMPALKLDQRIGPHSYLSPGLGLAGGNLERDLSTVERLAARHNSEAGVISAWRVNSEHRRDWAAATVRRVLLSKKPDAVVAIWGLAYKENTNSTKNSPSLATIAKLQDVRLSVHDPIVPSNVASHPKLTAAPTPLDAVKNADALVILTPWPEYRLPPADIAAAMRGRLLLDPYQILDQAEAVRAGFNYHTLGRPPAP
jgi:UDPglucose 6-dehydrogenase